MDLAHRFANVRVVVEGVRVRVGSGVAVFVGLAA